MAIVNMKKATIIALQSDKDLLVNRLQSFGSFQMINLQEELTEGTFEGLTTDSNIDLVNQLEAKLAKVKYLIDFIMRYDKEKSSMFASKPVVEDAKSREYLNEENLDRIYSTCKNIDEKLAEIKNMETKQNNLMAQLQPWNSLDVPVEDIKNTKNTVIIIGFVPVKYSENYKNELHNLDADLQIEHINTNKENAYYLLVYHVEYEEKVLCIQKQFGWTKTTFSDLKGTINENILQCQETLKNLNNRREELNNQASGQLEHKKYLRILYDMLTVERDKKAVASNFAKTKSTFIVNGWLPGELVDSLKDILDNSTEAHTIEISDPKEEEDIPVLLDNPVLVRPLEMITEQYSLPNSRAIDPNTIMAPFFIMFFGMMVSDAGYGIILAALTGFALFKLDLQGGTKKLFGLLCLGGVSTTFWGALFGGWFGDAIKLKPIWFNPLDNPLKMLIFCLILGVIQLYVGMGIQAYKNIRRGNILDAIYDQGLWYLFLTGLMFLALPPVALAGKYMAIVGCIGLVLTQGRTEKNIIKKLVFGILSLYNVTSFLGDVLSYSRLFALGLATGVIGTVVNSMATMLGGSFIGNIFMVVFLVLGHSFNIAINVLGAYVHSSRLQYVEFFGKFFEGDGKPFSPFKINTKYVIIKR